MAGAYLHLEVDRLGVQARVIEPDRSRAMIVAECRILYRDLEPAEEGADTFDSAMDIIADQVDLTGCSAAAVFLSTGEVSFRTLTLPFRSEKKLRQVLPFELENSLPFSELPYITDFMVADSTDEGHMVVSASLPEQTVDRFFSSLSRFGIKPVIISPTGCSAGLAYAAAHREQSELVFIYISGAGTTFTLFYRHRLCAVRSMPGSVNSPEDIAGHLKQTLAGLSQRFGLDEQFEVVVCCEDDTFETGAMYAALELTVGKQLSFEANPGRIDAEALICSVDPDRPGAAGSLFNFCKGEYGSIPFIKHHLKQITAAVVLLIMATALMMVGAVMENKKLEQQVSQIDQAALNIFKSAFPGRRNVLDPYMEMKANVQSALKKAGSSGVGDSTPERLDIKVVALIAELSKGIDAQTDMEISRFIFNNNRLVLSGSTDNFNNVDRIKGKLEGSKLFRKVNISSAASDKKDNRVNFKFLIDI